MTDTQKVILIALLALGALCLIMGFTLSHYIGGFIRHVEREAQEEAEAEDARRAQAAGATGSESQEKQQERQAGT